MSNNHQLPLSVQPIISYPREAEVGKTYLMTIDLQTSGDDWPYEEEEYPIYCMLETSPLFSNKPVGEPAVVLHRFGGTYGAAQFLLTAAQEEMEGEIKVTLVNGWGVPIRALKLTEIKLKLMDVKAALKFVDSAVFATTQRYLNDAEATVIQGTWEGKTYVEMPKTTELKLMDIEAALKFVDSAVFATTQRHLNDAEATVVRGAWEGKNYVEMAKAVNRNLSLMRDIGAELFEIMSEALGEQVTKSNFRSVLERQSVKELKQVRESQPLKPPNLEEKIEDETAKKLNFALHDEVSVNEQQIDKSDLPTVIPQDFLESVARKQGVSDAELQALSLAMDGQTTSAIAHTLKISELAVRKRLSKVYEKFHISTIGPGKLTQLRQLLVSQYQTQQQQQTGNPSPVAPVLNTPHRNWGNAPDVSVFFGRSEELTTLENWIVNDRCRLIALVGMQGIGKTALSVKLAKQIENKFEYVIWHSLFYAPPINDLLVTLIKFISHRPQLLLPDKTDERISELVRYLRMYRCLLIIDNLDSIFSSEGFLGSYQEKYKDYGKFLRRLGEERHNSCLIITSASQPREVALLEGETLPVRSWQMTGLKEEDAKNIFKSKNLSDENKWRRITSIFRGNPLALKIVSANIKEFCSGSISEFFMFSDEYNERVVGSSWVEELMDMQFQGLSSLGKEMATCLAIEGEPVELQDWQRHISSLVPEPKDFEFFGAIESLERLALVEKVQTGFTLHPVVINYLKEELCDGIVGEILRFPKISKSEGFILLKRHCLIKAHEKVCKTGDEKLSPIVQIKERLYDSFKDENRLTEHLEEVLLKLQNSSPLEVGYAVDNLQALLSILV